MASDVQNYKCPACTGPLHFAAGSGKLECEYCGSVYEIEEMEKLYGAQEGAAEAAFEKNHAEGEGWGVDEGMKAYSCPSCGAELICDGNTAATSCPYCGNPTIVPGQFSSTLKPEYIIPFKHEKKAAVEALKNHYKGKHLLPKSFTDENHIDDIQGVYVPFWLYDGVATGEMTFEASIEHKTRKGNKEIIDTEIYDVERRGSIKYEKVPADASSRMPDEHMDSIEPYDYADLKPFSMAYLPGYLADKYDVNKEECRDRFVSRAVDATESAIKDTVEGYDDFNTISKDIKVKETGITYVLMPVWLLSTKWNDQDFLFAMNGQTGKLVGDLPVDKKRAVGYFFAVFGIGVAATLLIGALIGLSIVLNVVVPVLAAVIAEIILHAQMKSVGTEDASAYISEQGLELSVKRDDYVRTDTRTEIIDDD